MFQETEMYFFNSTESNSFLLKYIQLSRSQSLSYPKLLIFQSNLSGPRKFYFEISEA